MVLYLALTSANVKTKVFTLKGKYPGVYFLGGYYPFWFEFLEISRDFTSGAEGGALRIEFGALCQKATDDNHLLIYDFVVFIENVTGIIT